MNLVIRPLTQEETLDMPRFNNMESLQGISLSKIRDRVIDVYNQGEEIYERGSNVIDAAKGNTPPQNTANFPNLNPSKSNVTGLMVGVASVVGSIFLIKHLMG